MKLIRISSSWCTSCIITYPIWNELKEKYPNFEYEELDYDMNDISNYNVGEILPVIIIQNDNKEIARIIGEKKKEEIIKIIEECL